MISKQFPLIFAAGGDSSRISEQMRLHNVREAAVKAHRSPGGKRPPCSENHSGHFIQLLTTHYPYIVNYLCLKIV